MRRLFFAAMLALTPLSATAETPARPSASTADTARARAEGDAIIAAAGVGDLFTNVTDGASIQLRHNASGMVCGFDPGGRNSIALTPGVERNLSVACGSNPLDFTRTLYASRSPGVTNDQALAGAVAGIRQVYTDVVPYGGQGMTMTQEGEAPSAAPRTAAFEAKLNGREVFTLVSVAERNGWIIKIRMTGPRSKAFEAQLFAGVAMRAVLLKIDEAKP